MRLLTIAALLLAATTAAAVPVTMPSGTYYVFCNSSTAGDVDPTCTVKTNGSDGNNLVSLEYSSGMMTTGWDNVTVAFNNADAAATTTLLDKYFAAGFLEGYVTYENMYNQYLNNIASIEVSLLPEVKNWVVQNQAWLANYSKHAASDDAVAQKVGQLLAQIRGLELGYKGACAARGNCDAAMQVAINSTIITYLNLYEELGDLVTAFNTTTPFENEVLRDRGHCSALVKLLPGDIYMSHVTWNAFTSMLRQYKTYQFEGKSFVSMSSYPSVINSIDDWYMTGHGLATQETTNGVYNNTLFQKNFPGIYNVIPAFMRVMIANYLATDSLSWTNTFAIHNSGTYNNQWMILDMKTFVPGSALPDNFFRVLETLPGLVVSADVTEVLRTKTYFASYNLPYFPEITQLSGTNRMEAIYGNFYSHSKYARAEIFARNHTDVVDMASMKALMRYNNYRHDPLSLISNCTGAGVNNTCSPPYSSMLSIASRGDLNPPGGASKYGPNFNFLTLRNHCGTDVKLASYTGMMKQSDGCFRAEIISGPTTYNSQPIFNFSTSPPIIRDALRYGIPDSFTFPFQTVSAKPRIFPSPPSSNDEDSKSTFAIGVALGALGGGIIVFAIGTLLILTICRPKKDKGGQYKPLH